MNYTRSRSGVSPVRETQLHLHAAVANSRKVAAARAGLIHLEPIPVYPCGRTYDGNDYCTKPDGHRGPCNIRRADEVES